MLFQTFIILTQIRKPRNYEAEASEYLANIKEIFPRFYYMHSESVVKMLKDMFHVYLNKACQSYELTFRYKPLKCYNEICIHGNAAGSNDSVSMRIMHF